MKSVRHGAVVVLLLTACLGAAGQDVQTDSSFTAADTTRFGFEVMNQVEVKARKQAYEQKSDRTIINVRSMVTASGGSVLDVLQKSPGVTVNRQASSITLNGKSGVRIMLNGKISQLPPDAVLAMLEGMGSGSVEKIELIHTPSAKYDADGAGGAINIVTRIEHQTGTHAITGVTYGYHAKSLFGGNLSVNHRGRKTAYYLEYSATDNHNEHEVNFKRQTISNGVLNIITDVSRRPNITKQQNIDLGFEWTPDTSTAYHVSLTGYRRNWKLAALNVDNEKNDHETEQSNSIIIHESNIWQSATSAAGIRKNIGKHSTININTDYLYYKNDNPSYYTNTCNCSSIDLQKKTPIKMLVNAADYQYSKNNYSIEAGAKEFMSTLKNDVVVINKKDGGVSIDSFFTNSSTLHENISAAYIAGRFRMNRWQLTPGLRYEYTQTTVTTGWAKILDRKYGQWFPSLAAALNFGSQKELQLSYSRRIMRPTYNDIAPYVFFWGPKTFSSGNTALKPAVTDAIRIGLHLHRWTTSIDAAHTTNEMVSYQPSIDTASGNITYRSENLKYANVITLTNAYSVDVTGWWRVQATLANQYQVIQTLHLLHNIKRSLFNVNVNIVNMLILPHDFAVELSGIYQSKTLLGMSDFLSRGSLNAGVQKSLGRQGTIKLAADDIFATDKWRYKAISAKDNINTYFDYSFHNRYVRITYTRNIGNDRLNIVKSRSAAEEERRRVN